MAQPKSKERLLCEDYCRLYPKDKMQTLALAKKIFAENHKNFPGLKSVQHVYNSYVRDIRGLKGKAARAKASDKSLFQPVTYDTTVWKPYKEEIKAAKILILDIETAPLKGWIWDVWNQNISPDQIESDWFILTWSAKWLFEKKVHGAGLTSAEALLQSDKRIMKALWSMVNEADIVIAHNGERFDIPRINTRFVIHKMHPPLPYIQIDTLKQIRRQFAFSHNKLDYVNGQLNLKRKMDTGGFQLWKQCYSGDTAALKKMLKYNCQDVLALEENYLRFRSWIRPHPNIGLYILDKVSRCPSCGSDDIKWSKKYYYTSVNRYEAFRCNNCGSLGRKRTSDITVPIRRFLTTSIAK